MGIADLHVHTIYSPDGTSRVEDVLEEAVNRVGLDVIAITDHDTIEGARYAQKISKHFGIEVILGCEVTTNEGHLLTLDIREPIRKGMSLEETLTEVKRQGGYCIVPHPLGRGLPGMKAGPILKALANPELRDVLLGIETNNGSLLFSKTNVDAKELCRQVGLAAIGNSDSHAASQVGLATTSFPGRTANDLKEAILRRKTVSVMNRSVSSRVLALEIGWRLIQRYTGLINTKESEFNPATL